MTESTVNRRTLIRDLVLAENGDRAPPPRTGGPQAGSLHHRTGQRPASLTFPFLLSVSQRTLAVCCVWNSWPISHVP